MEITFLGTSSMVPTKDRNHSGMFITCKSHGILMDCGEGTQRQMKIAGINLVKINKILISHWHGDHMLGLPGLLQSLSSSSNTYAGILEIYGPKGFKENFELLKEALQFELTFEVKLIEVKEGIIFIGSDYQIESRYLEHSILSAGYSIIENDVRHIKMDYVKKLKIPDGPLLGKLQRGEDVSWDGNTIFAIDATKVTKGKKLTVIPDTGLCRNCVTLAKGADLLICESTYANSMDEKAEKYKHLTAGQAGQIANNAEVKKLILTHFSQRYKNTTQIEEDVKSIFDKSTCARDFMKVRI